MRQRKIQLAAAAFFLAISASLADTTTEKVQRTLKEQGFYYGEATGQMDADTTAAIRRYQIRNGLKVTGDLDAETQKSLGVSSGATAKSTPRPQITPIPEPHNSARAPERENSSPDENSDLRDGSSTELPPQLQGRPRPTDPEDEVAPGAPSVRPEAGAIFSGTPYDAAPSEVQRRVIVGAQTLLARRGYYRSDIDGFYGPGMQFALRAFQDREGLPPTGRLDMETLAALGLLPGQQERGFGPARRHFMRRPPVEIGPDGEPIYVPH
ncbi:MAG: peptidoglycan-binding protein [Chthoniobacterales bacterium]